MLVARAWGDIIAFSGSCFVRSTNLLPFKVFVLFFSCDKVLQFFEACITCITSIKINYIWTLTFEKWSKAAVAFRLPLYHIQICRWFDVWSLYSRCMARNQYDYSVSNIHKLNSTTGEYYAPLCLPDDLYHYIRFLGRITLSSFACFTMRTELLSFARVRHNLKDTRAMECYLVATSTHTHITTRWCHKHDRSASFFVRRTEWFVLFVPVARTAWFFICTIELFKKNFRSKHGSHTMNRAIYYCSTFDWPYN